MHPFVVQFVKLFNEDFFYNEGSIVCGYPEICECISKNANTVVVLQLEFRPANALANGCSETVSASQDISKLGLRSLDHCEEPKVCQP